MASRKGALVLSAAVGLVASKIGHALAKSNAPLVQGADECFSTLPGQVGKLHVPVLRVAASSTLSFAALVSLHLHELGAASPLAFSIASTVGIGYTQLFEYLYHRHWMHRLPGAIGRSHLEHHRIFHGENFATRSETDLEHVAGRWFLFPPCLALHYLLARSLVEPELALGFLAGCLVHYLGFEITHWFAHVEDNAFDRVIGRIPGLGALRAYQLAHHREHHERPGVNFNFNPPYLGDVLAGSLDVTRDERAQRSGGVLAGGRRWSVARSKA